MKYSFIVKVAKNIGAVDMLFENYNEALSYANTLRQNKGEFVCFIECL
jgi:hypothetical protein